MSRVVDPPAHARHAFLWACGLDVAVRKPGNVSVASPGHGMRAPQFLASARAAATPLTATGAGTGARIEAAVAAAVAAAGCNTNLGILLLCAPLADAWERCGGAPDGLRPALAEVLGALGVDDAAAAYRAILVAHPGGLGRAPEQDVADPPSIGLRQAMTLAAGRDSIARQYRDGFADLAGAGLGELFAAAPHGGRLGDAVQRVYLRFLAGWVDSHIVRKLGPSTAHTVTCTASHWLAALRRRATAGRGGRFAAWDEALKRRGINPGTSADLTVATLFMAALTVPALVARGPSDTWHGTCMASHRSRCRQDQQRHRP